MIAKPLSATIEQINGGSFSGLTEIPACVPHDVMLYHDAAREQRAIGVDGAVVCIPAGEGETLRTILSDFPDEKLKEFVNRHPGMPADAGMAATPAIGYANVAKLLSDERTWRLVQSVCSKVFQGRGGHVQNLTINTRAGTAGGQGSLTALPTALAIAQPFLDRGVAVHIHEHRIGALTYDGIRDDARLDVNNAATVLQDLYEIHHAGAKPALLTVELTLMEMPPVKRNKRLRDYYVRTLCQTYAASEVKKLTQTSGSNEATSSDLGNVNLVQGEWFERIENPAIAQCAALAYLPRVKELLTSRPPAGLIVSLGFTTRRDRARCLSFEDFCRHISGSADHDQLFAAAQTPEVEYRCVAHVVLADGTRIELQELDDYLSRPTATFGEFASRKHFVDAMLTELKSRQEEYVRAYKRALRKLAYEVAKFSFCLLLVKPARPWQAVMGAFLTNHSKYTRLRKRFERLRRAAAEVARYQEILTLVRATRKLLKREARGIARTLVTMAKALRPFYPLQPVSPESRPVTVLPIDEAFDRLRSLDPDQRLRNEDLFARLVSRVTLTGLAEILGASGPRVETIAQQVLQGSATTVGPPWGNCRRLHRGVTITVLPPVEDKLKSQLLQQISKLDKTALVAFGDTAVGGVTSVRLHIATPLSIAENGHREILTPYLKSSLARVQEQPELNFPRGTESLQWLQSLSGPNGHRNTETK